MARLARVIGGCEARARDNGEDNLLSDKQLKQNASLEIYEFRERFQGDLPKTGLRSDLVDAFPVVA